MTTKRDTLVALRSELKAALELVEGGEIEAGRQKYLEVEAQLEALQLESPYVLFCLADTFRRAKETTELEAGFVLCCQAVQLDPLHPALMDQFTEYGNLLRRRLEVLSREPAQPAVPRLYATLQRTGEADAGSHVAMARHHAGAGQLAEATRLLKGTVLLEPGRADAWQLLAEVARQAGNQADAVACEARVATLEAHDAPYGVPSAGVAC